MEIDPSLTSFYRYQFREILQDRASQVVSERPTKPPMLFADLITAGLRQPPANVQPSEAIHEVDERPLPDVNMNAGPIKPVDPRGDSWTTDTAMNAESTALNPSPELRRALENEIRRAKRAGIPCPRCTPDGFCGAVYLRCGNRQQHAIPETPEQRRLPHRCRYLPDNPGKCVLIVDDDPTIRDFCRSSLEIFFSWPAAFIFSASSATEALEITNAFKVEDRQCRMCIIDIDMTGLSGWELVNQLYVRNCDIEIIVLRNRIIRTPRPALYAGDIEVLPGHPFVSAALEKPFSSDDFIKALEIAGMQREGRSERMAVRAYERT
jgi:CheY-like chemotaxis protein